MTGTDDGEHLLDDDVLAELRAIGGGVASVDLPWEEPPAGLWDRIAAEAGVATSQISGVDAPDRADPAPIPLRPNREEASNGGGGRFGTAGPRLLVAAAVLAVLVAGAALIAEVTGSGDDGSGTAVIAASDLEALTDRGSGHAELVDHDGRLELRVDVADLDPDGGFLEVWMIDPDVTGLISLGPVRADGVYALPPGMDPAAFPIVDVSVEPIDGDPGHSGASVLRAQLDI